MIDIIINRHKRLKAIELNYQMNKERIIWKIKQYIAIKNLRKI